MVGASRQANEYSKSAKKGNTRSAFASITSNVFTFALRDDTSLGGMFRDAVKLLHIKVLDHTSAQAIVKKANEVGATKGELDHPVWTRSNAMNETVKREEFTREELEQEMRMFTLQYGTDFVTHATMGGKVTQTISTKSNVDSSVDNEALTKSARASFQMVFYKANAQKSTMMETNQKTATEEQTETFKEVFEGGIPNEDWHAWCRSTMSAPVPVEYITREIADLVSITMSKPDVGERLAAFIGRMISKMEECEQFGQGLEYDKQSGQCKLGNDANNCHSGQFKEDLEEDEYITADKRAKSVLMASKKGRVEYEQCSLPGSKCIKVGSKGEKICRNCPRGKHLAAGGSTTCKACKSGTFAENEGMAQCQECPMGRDSNAEAQACPFMKGEFYMQTVTNDGWEDGAGHSDRKNYMQPASLGQAERSIGDADIKDGAVKGGEGWAYADAKDMNHKVTLKHEEGTNSETYQISGSTANNYLGLTTEGDGWNGISSTFGEYWAYFGQDPQYWKLIATSKKDYFYLESSKHSGVYLGAADYDDGDDSRVCGKETNCPWVVGGDRTHDNKCPSPRTIVDASSLMKANSKGMSIEQEKQGCANWLWKMKSLSPAAPTRQPTAYDADAPTPPPTSGPTLQCTSRNTRGTCSFWAGCDGSRKSQCVDGLCVCNEFECAHDGKCVDLGHFQTGLFSAR